MQEALTPELERRCENEGCAELLPPRRRKYCSPACAKKAANARDDERHAQLASKICRDCQKVQPIGEFRPPRSPRCLACTRLMRQVDYERRGGKEYIYGHNLKRYGLTLEEYQDKLATQEGRCAICGDEPPEGKRLHVDHNHETGAVRDLLCRWCNYALGNVKDEPGRLLAMISYLERHGIPLTTGGLLRGGDAT